MKTYYKDLIIIFLLTFSFFSKAQTSYTWTGSHSSNWNDSLNWTPKGIPQSNDNIKVEGENNILILDHNIMVNSCTLQSIYLDLKGYNFSVNGTATMNAVKISAGNLSFTGPFLSFVKVITKANVNAVCASITINNSYFDSTAYLERTGNSASDSWGSNIFSQSATLVQNSPNSTWNISKEQLLEVFNGDVTFFAKLGALKIAAVNSCLFSGNLILSSTGEGISLGDTSSSFLIGNSTIAEGKAITTTGFTSGQLSLYKITQAGTSPNNFQLSGTATIVIEQCNFGGNVSISSDATDTTKVGVSLSNCFFRQSTTINAALINLQGNNFNVSNTTGSQTQIRQMAASNENQLQTTNMINGTFITK